MEEQRLVEVLREKEVRGVYRSLYDQLNLLPPNGQTNHRRATVTHFFLSHTELYDEQDGNFKSETFTDLSERDQTLYRVSIKNILESVNRFNVRI